jgi:glycogen(starch) synthase
MVAIMVIEVKGMRVCLLTPGFPPYQVGGIGAYIEVLAQGLGAQGHTVDVVGCDISPSPGIETRKWGRVISLTRAAHNLNGEAAVAVDNFVRTYTSRIPGIALLKPFVDARWTTAAALLLRQFILRNMRRYDVVEYSNWPGEAAFLPPGPAGTRVARLSSSVADTGGSWVLLAMESRAVSRADVVITHSVAMNQKGQKLYGYPPERSVVVPLGLPDRRPEANPTSTGPLTLISLGRAEDRKGTDMLLAALARVLPNFPQVVFRHIGALLPRYLAERPETRVAWERLLETCPGRVEDLGSVSEADKDRAIETAHWLVAPSRFESFGLMAAEAMRAGTPVVYGAEGGLAEVGALGPRNIAVRGGDLDDLVRALQTVCEAGAGAAMAARPATRAAFERHLRDDKMVESTLSIYRQLLAGKWAPSVVNGGGPRTQSPSAHNPPSAPTPPPGEEGSKSAPLFPGEWGLRANVTQIMGEGIWAK